VLKRLETVTNIAILVVAVLATVALIRYLRSDTQVPAPPQILAGSRLELQGVNWSANRSTLVLALSTTCHFCSESAPFYQRLLDRAPKTVHLMAIFPQGQSDGPSYLKSLAVNITDVHQSSFGSLHVRGTPTLLLVDQTGVVRKAWTGKLSSQVENEVFTTIGRGM
jgi:hypothetical protein